MEIYEIDLKIPRSKSRDIFKYLHQSVEEVLEKKKIPIRFVITASDDKHYHCELGVIEGNSSSREVPSIFSFKKREFQNGEQYNIALLVPTGIGAEIGGHAGDACPVAKMFSPLCDNLITHPNVVNASDLNEMPMNGLYVEGSMICRLLMGTIRLGKVDSNRVLLLIDKNENEFIRNDYINCFNSARASCGLRGDLIVEVDPPLHMSTQFTSSKRASGRVSHMERLISIINKHRHEFDALAIATVIKTSNSTRKEYFQSMGKVNPWGGVEAILTHALSLIYDCPSAHAPMVEDEELDFYISGEDRKVIDPRKAAEILSTTCLFCILKGLQRSPKIITNNNTSQGTIGVEDISCLVIPDGCLSLPVFAALEQGITVIAVKENRNLMRNDLSSLPWQSGQFYQVENYWEAAGIISAIRGGIAPETVRRPIKKAVVKTG